MVSHTGMLVPGWKGALGADLVSSPPRLVPRASLGLGNGFEHRDAIRKCDADAHAHHVVFFNGMGIL